MKRNNYSTWYVYTIVNQKNKVEYVGTTAIPKKRMYQHTCNSKSSGSGKFAGRKNKVKMEIVAEFNNRTEAVQKELNLKQFYGLEVTERTRLDNVRIKAPVKAFDKITGQLIGNYISSKVASEALGVGFRSISANLKGRVKSAGGYIFQPL